MSLTLAQLWGEVARNMGGVYLDGTATGGSTTTIIDTTALPAIGADDYVNNAYACIINDAAGAHAAPEGQTRVTSDFVRSTGVVTVGTAFTVAPAVGDSYRLWTGMPRTDMVDAVKAALRSAWPAFYTEAIDETLAVIASTYEYSLPATIFHLTDVFQQSDAAASHYDRVPDWRIKETGATRTLQLEPRHDYIVGRTLRLVGIAPLSCPANDYTALTIAPEWEQPLLEYVGFYGAALAHQRMLARDRDNRDYHLTVWRDLNALAIQAKAKHMPRPPMRATVDYPRYWSKE